MVNLLNFNRLCTGLSNALYDIGLYTSYSGLTVDTGRFAILENDCFDPKVPPDLLVSVSFARW